MPFTLFYTPSFKRSVKALGSQQREIVGTILETLEIYFSTGCDLENARKVAPRFFYKQLRKPYYEAGIESNIRVVIHREKEHCFLMLAGNHDQIKRFLGNV